MNHNLYDPATKPGLSNDTAGAGRRKFLQVAGLAAVSGTAILSAACSDKSSTSVVPMAGKAARTDGTAHLTNDDFGILNYAFALEQLEAAFYTMVTSNAAFTTIFSPMEQRVFREIRDHEIIHREFFKAALSTAGIIDLTPNFDAIKFGDRTSVLTYAKTFEDLGVAAYNGAGKFIKSVDYLLLAGKIVSIEARHASVIRDLINPKSRDFAGDDVVMPVESGLDQAFLPSKVLSMAGAFVKDTITSDLP